MAAVPFRVFGPTARSRGPKSLDHPLVELAARLKSCRRSVPRLLVREPTMPLAVSSAVWVSRASAESIPEGSIPTPASFTFLQSISTVNPSRFAAALRLLSWTLAPYSTRQIRRSTTRRGSMPPAFRLQGLFTLLAVYSLRTPAAVLGRPQRSWDSPLRSIRRPAGYRHVSAAMDPRTVSPAPNARERTLRTATRAAASGP